MSAETIKMHGIDLIYRSGSDVWVACFGPDYFVHFSQLPGGIWRAWKPRALEPIALGKTLSLCLHNALRHYEALRAETRERVARKLADPIVQKAIMGKECIR
jgi:hypothetical protein